MTEQQTKELFRIHIVTSNGYNILASGRNFLEAFEKGATIEGAFLVTAYWFHREIPVWIAALDQLYVEHEFGYGQRVDLAIEYLRAQGVQCSEFTSYLLRQSRYGTAPAGSVTETILAEMIKRHLGGLKMAQTEAEEDYNYEYDEEGADCLFCGGDGWIDGYEDDPLWYAPGELERCASCNGSGRRKDMTIW